MIRAYIDYWKRALDFKGRTSRKDFWYAFIMDIIFLIIILFVVGVYAIFNMLSDEMFDRIFDQIFIIYIVITFLPHTSMMVRRFHDINRSGIFVLLFGVITFCMDIYQFCILKLPIENYIQDGHPYINVYTVVTLIIYFALLFVFCIKGTNGQNKFD